MYVTRPLSLYKRSPESLALPPPEGPNSGYLVIFYEECETTTCFGLCKNKSIKHLPLPQSKDLTILYTDNHGEISVTYYDDALFIPVIDEPLSSNRYYVIRRQGKHKGQECANSKEEDKGTFFCCTCIRDAKPRPLDPSDIYQQFEIIRKKLWRIHRGFYAKSVPPDGFPPKFLRRKYWGVNMRKARNYHLSEAQGLNSSLRARLPEFNFSPSNESSEAVVVGKWYCPFMFVEEDMVLKDQMKLSTFYEMTLEQRWDMIFGCNNVGNNTKMVHVDVFVNREEVFVAGRRAVSEERNVENGVIWFKSCDNSTQGEVRVGLSMKIMERMKWEQEKAGSVGEDKKQVRVERRETCGGTGLWSKFGYFMLVERFVLKRMDGSIVLAYDFKHTQQIRCKWDEKF